MRRTDRVRCAASAAWRGLETLEPRMMLAANLVITEFMADNVSILADQDGEYSDWLEIYNPGPEDVNLGGWYLTDNVNDLRKWGFPSQTLPAGQFLVVFASNKNRATAGQQLHTNFALSASGEYLGLVFDDPGNGLTRVSEYFPQFPPQQQNLSYGPTQSVNVNPVLASTAAAKVFFPTNDSLGTSWTQPGFNDASWANSNAGIGYEVVTPGWQVRDIKANVQIVSLSIADSVVAGQNVASEVEAIAPYLDYYDADGGGSTGRYNNNRPFPGNTPNDDDDFVIVATGTFTVPAGQGGLWTIGTNASDGLRVRIDGTAVITDNTTHPPSDRFGYPNLTPGPHTIEVVYFDRSQVAGLEVFASFGFKFAWDSTFKLIGDTANGGLPVESASAGGSTSGFSSQFTDNVEAEMRGVTSSAYLRIPFNVASVDALDTLRMRANYDDGFIAYLNGTEILRRNAPATPTYNGVAPENRPAGQAITDEIIDISLYKNLLNNGQNLLAIHAFNEAINSNEFLFAVDLEEVEVVTGDLRYFNNVGATQRITPGAFNSSTGIIGFLNGVTFSHEGGFFNSPFQVTITPVDAYAQQIRYTLDGSAPTATSPLYTGPLTISQTTVLRAASFATGFDPSVSRTRTFLFLQDVLLQSQNGVPPAGYPTGSVNGQVLNWGMDPDIVNSATWAPQMIEALTQIPSLSIVTSIDNMFGATNGIYTHAGNHGIAWEREASLELLNPDGSDGFQVNMGVRIRGGFSRSGSNPKHAFRLFFREEYGDSKLNFPMFEDEGADQFDKLDLRTTQNYSWSFGGDSRNTFLRDIVSRDMQGAAGQPYTRGRHYHLYINGQYWGLYQTEERPEANYGETYFGGNDEDYDVVKSTAGNGGHANEYTDGNSAAYMRLRDFFVQPGGLGDANHEAYMRAQGYNLDGTRNMAYERLLDVDNLIDYMIITYWTSDADGPGSRFTRPGPNNYFGIYNRVNPDGWKFFEHDSEHAFNTGDAAGANYNMVTPLLDSNASSPQNFNPHWMHQALMGVSSQGIAGNTEYRTKFFDRVYDTFFNDGIFTDQNIIAMFQRRAAEIDMAIIGESARWGDSIRSVPFTKNDWTTAVNNLLNWITSRNGGQGRGSEVINQLRAANPGGPIWYPNTLPARYSQHGGTFDDQLMLTLIPQGAGTVYYTLDGTDPRLPGGNLNPNALVYTGGTITLHESIKLKTRTRNGAEWSPLNDAEFINTTESLRITEIMYNPADPDGPGGVDAQSLEYIELTNIGDHNIILTDLRFTNGINFDFATNPYTTLGPGERIVVASNVAAFSAHYNTAGIKIAGQYSGQLNNAGEAIELTGLLDIVRLSFEYDDAWYPLTDGGGFSLRLVDEMVDPSLLGEASSWRPSSVRGGSPGLADPNLVPGINSVIINEALTNSPDAADRRIEIHNRTGAPIDISGWYLSNDPNNLVKYTFPAGTIIGGGGYLVLSEELDFGNLSNPNVTTAFGLSALSGAIILHAGDGMGTLLGYRDDVDYDGSDEGVSFGRHINSINDFDFVAMTTNTFGAANAAPVVGPIVLNEIMYNPAPHANPVRQMEWIELHNTSGSPVDLFVAGDPSRTWLLGDGVQFDFPAGTTIPANGFLIVTGGDPAAFRAEFGIPLSVAVLGPYVGNLANEGEDVELMRRGATDIMGQTPLIVVDRVAYDDIAPWPTLPDGNGSTLSRFDGTAFGNEPNNWLPSGAGGTPGAVNDFFDTSAPTIPANVALTLVSPTRVDLVWDESQDPQSFVDHYNIYRNSVLVGTSPTADFSDMTVQVGVAYVYEVTAVNRDAAESARSDATDSLTIMGIESAVAPLENRVRVVFSEPVVEADAEDIANYGIDRHTRIFSATLGPDGRTVTLHTTSITAGDTFTITAANIAGLSGNQVAPNTTATFVLSGVREDFMIRQVHSTTALTNLASADALLALPPGNPGIESEATVFGPFIDFKDDDGSTKDGRFDNNLPFPDNNTGNDDHFAVKATGTITIPEGMGGQWTFATNIIGGVETLVTRGSTWKYLDNGTNQGTAWKESAFNDAAWASGPAQLGYGDGDEATTVGFGPDANNKYVTTYFRKSFTLADASAIKGLTLRLLRDDGAAVYLNGTEIARSNLAAGAAFNTFATAVVDVDESTFFEFTGINPNLLVNGTNVIAVEVHQVNATSSDLSFDLELEGSTELPPPPVTGTNLISAFSTWKYLDNGTNQGTAWRNLGFNDAAWPTGTAELGYGDGDEITTVGFGPDANNKFVTTYFRKTFTVADASTISTLRIRLLRDDGAAVYLNGQEILRDNLAPDATFTTYATNVVGSPDEATFFVYANIPATALVTGTNVLAVEVHQVNATSSDMSFNLQLEGFAAQTDDGMRLSIDGFARTTQEPGQPENNRFVTVTLGEGPHSLDLLFLELTGASQLELFAAPGAHTSFNNQFRLVGDIANGGLPVSSPGSPPNVAPVVVDVMVAGSSWSQAYLDQLEAAGLGDGRGYSIPLGAGQLDDLIWGTVDQIKVVFSEHVNISAGDLALAGGSVADYIATVGLAGFSYDATTKTAVWTLNSAIGADNLTMTISDSVTDQAGAALDGEWAGVTDAAPSGNDAEGGDFVFAFNVKPGDINGDGTVNDLDIDALYAHINGGGGGAIQGAPLAFDLNGSGAADANDVAALVRNILKTQFGDANLDRRVNITDLSTVALNFGAVGTGWRQGNFNGDNATNISDLSTLATFFGFDNSGGGGGAGSTEQVNLLDEAPVKKQRVVTAPTLTASSSNTGSSATWSHIQSVNGGEDDNVDLLA